jgi:hypothetical protein
MAGLEAFNLVLELPETFGLFELPVDTPDFFLVNMFPLTAGELPCL